MRLQPTIATARSHGGYRSVAKDLSPLELTLCVRALPSDKELQSRLPKLNHPSKAKSLPQYNYSKSTKSLSSQVALRFCVDAIGRVDDLLGD